MDWGDGQYELTARLLEPVSELAVAAAGIAPGHRVLDVGCGTGNAAIAAARRGASVVAVDPSPRLLEVASQRARDAGLELTCKQAEAASLPAPDAAFDIVLSVFAVIFAPDAEAAARELMRVVRPVGRLVLTTWTPEGPLFEAGKLLWEAAPREPMQPTRKPPAWGRLDDLTELFSPLGGTVTATTHALSFEAESAEAYFRLQEAHHPAWRAVKQLLADEAWASVRQRSIEVFQAHNQAAAGFRVTSHYLLVTVTR